MSDLLPPTWKEFTNALSWFAAAPARWLKSAEQDLSAAAQWIWEVIQGDFNDNQSTAQTVTSTVISMIPIVDQICDVRDVVANCRKINQDTSNKWAWVALVLTLIGLFPVLGSLVKGCFKILFAYGRKAMAGMGKAAFDPDLWKFTGPYVEAGIKKLNEFLARPEVRKALAAMKWDNVYKELAKLMRELSAQLSVGALTKVFDGALVNLKSLLDWVQKWGNAAMKTQAGELYKMVKGIRDQANAKLGEVVKPVQDWLNRLARRLEIEHQAAYTAKTNVLNASSWIRLSQTAEEAAFKKSKPAWVDETTKIAHVAQDKAVAKTGWPDISELGPKRPTLNAYKTFAKGMLEAKIYPPGTVLYRVVDPQSTDNSICWMTKVEFDKLKSKDDWRRTFAVWANWNSNGEYVKYTVPPGKGLNAWEGVTASQKMEVRGKPKYVLEGGARQIVIDPKDFDPKFFSKREFTNWGYDDLGHEAGLIGVPFLSNNLYK